jgi:tetratricopeptide (TPR) repeat protein
MKKLVLALAFIGLLSGLTAQDYGEEDKEIAALTQAIKRNPNDAAAYNSRGNAWYRKGELDKAIEDFTEALRLKADYVEAYYNRGLVWYDKGDYAKAIADFTEAIRIAPCHDEAYYRRGLAQYYKGDIDRAGTDWKGALHANPNHAGARQALETLGQAADNKQRGGQVQGDTIHEPEYRKNNR